jgi:hypothetical protein
MPCRDIKLPNGFTGIACSRERRRACSVPGCGRTAPYLCDYPVKRKGKDTTCNRAMCEAHRKNMSPEVDYCPGHTEYSAGKAAP